MTPIFRLDMGWKPLNVSGTFEKNRGDEPYQVLVASGTSGNSLLCSGAQHLQLGHALPVEEPVESHRLLRVLGRS